MKTFIHSLALAASLASAAALAPTSAAAAGHGGGGHAFAGSGHSFGGSGWHGGPGRGRGGFSRGGWGGHRGYWPGAFWGGIGLGLGVGAVGYYNGYYNGYYAPYPYYDGYYDDAPEIIVSPAYGNGAPAGVARSGQPVPQASRAADPIFYPRNGQSTATTESDRRDCNRWATTQPGAMADASIFQRATFACMEGRGYTAR
jgi:hypothetical protein